MSRTGKRLLTLSLAVVLAIAFLPGNTGFVGVVAAGNTAPDCSTVSYTGDGTSSSPYEVSNVDQLQCMGEDHANATDKSDALSSHYVLVSDIDASGTENWNSGAGFDPIGDCGNSHSHLYNNCGTSPAPFTGTFDGQSYRISNLTIDRPNGVAVGLFGLAENATFESIRLENVSITGEENVGGLVGHMQKDGGGYPVGSVKNVSVRGSVTWSGVNDESASGGKFGGIVGLAANTPLDNENVFVGNVTGQYNVGGLVGRMAWSTTIGNSYARGTVTSTASSDLAECGGNDKCEAGGLAGNSGNPSDITNAYAAVTVDAPTVGAIIGDDNGGTGEDTLTNVYWDKDVGPSVASGGPIDDANSGEYAGLSTSEMQGSSAETNMNFDWTNSWQTVASDYPVFQWEATAVENSTIHSIEASNVTVAENASGQITVTATDEFGNMIDGKTIEVTNADGLDGLSANDTAVTDTNGEATFTFVESANGTYTPTFVWQNDTNVSDTATVTVQNAPEVSSIVRASGESNPTNADSVQFEVTFTESVSGVDTGDFTATQVSGDVSASVSSVSNSSGTVITVTVNGTTGDGDLRLDLNDDDSITNGNGVPLGGSGTTGSGDGSFTGGQTFTIDNTPSNPPPTDGDKDETGTEPTGSVHVESAGNTTIVTITGVEGPRNITIETVTTMSEPAREGEDGDTSTPGPAGLKNVVMEHLSVTVENVSQGEINVTARELSRETPIRSTTDLAANHRAFTIETGSVPVGVVTVEHTVPDDSISKATFEFSIRKDFLASRNVTTDEVALFRDESTGWNELPTTQVGENSTHYRFEAESPGFSRFVIGTTRPVFDVRTVSLDRDTIALGESATVTVTVENVGGVAGSYEASLLVDGDAHDTQTVSVPARSDESLTFDVSPSATGSYELAVSNRTLTLAVERASETGTPDDKNETPEIDDPEDTEASGLPWGFVIPVLVGGLLLAGFLWQRDDEEGGENERGRS